MAKQERQAKISFCYDRMWEQKLSQIYHLLVPANSEIIPTEQSSNELIENSLYENSSDIYKSVLRSAEGE